MIVMPMGVRQAADFHKLSERIARLRKGVTEETREDKIDARKMRQMRAALAVELPDPRDAEIRLERVIAGNDLTGVNYLSIGALRARSVCRIRVEDAQGQPREFGTGFLIAPGVVMTNWHVVRTPGRAKTTVAEFDYELDALQHPKPSADFPARAAPSIILVEPPLDFCLLALPDRSTDGKRGLDEFGYLPLNPTPGKAVVGEYLSIIQHPDGGFKQVCVRENKLLEYDESQPRIIYETDTVGGSSGSPVFNQLWQVVGLHRAGFPRTDSKGRWLTKPAKGKKAQVWDPATMSDDAVDWIGNEGVRVSKILEHIEANFADHPVAKRVLEASRRKAPDESAIAGDSGVGAVAAGGGAAGLGRRIEIKDGVLSMTLPIEVRVPVGAGFGVGAGIGAVIASGSIVSPAAFDAAALTESAKVSVPIISDYEKRKGYREDFLGDGALRVPMPKPRSGGPKALEFTWQGKKTTKIDYYTYSVVMHASKRFAVVAAVNIDQSLKKTERPDTTWTLETKRIGAKSQVGGDLYAGNDFDRGHLCKSEDCAFGATIEEAQRNAADSFHFTNCTPQHTKFNEHGWWFKFEDWVVEEFAAQGSKVSVFNGPVFNAPRSTRLPNGRLRINPDGKSSKDPTYKDFKGISIPKVFYKIAAYIRHDGKPASIAFLLTHEELLATMPGIKGLAKPLGAEEAVSAADVRFYQVPVTAVEKLTGLDFGPLRDWDALTHGFKPGEAFQVGGSGVVAVESLDDMRMD